MDWQVRRCGPSSKTGLEPSGLVQESDGLALLDSRGWQVLTTRDGLSNPEVKAMLQDNEGNLWIGTRDGLTRINIQGLVYLYSEQ